MTALAQSLEMVPETYQDDSFDVVVRDNRSVAVFWDLGESSKEQGNGSSLHLKVQSDEGAEIDTFELNHESGHMIVPLTSDARSYEIQIGWGKAQGFHGIAASSVELPPLVKMQAHHEANFLLAAFERREIRSAKSQ